MGPAPAAPSPATGGHGCPGTRVGSAGPSPAKPTAPEGTAAPNNTASVCLETITALFPRYIFMKRARRMAFLWGNTKGLCAVLRLELACSSLPLHGPSSSGGKPTRAPKPPRPGRSTTPPPRARLAGQPAGGGGIRWARAVPSCSSQSPDPLPPRLSAEGPASQTNK